MSAAVRLLDLTAPARRVVIELAKGVRKVRTQQGAEYYGLPIGSPITPGVRAKAKQKSGGSGPPAAEKAAHAPKAGSSSGKGPSIPSYTVSSSKPGQHSTDGGKTWKEGSKPPKDPNAPIPEQIKGPAGKGKAAAAAKVKTDASGKAILSDHKNAMAAILAAPKVQASEGDRLSHIAKAAQSAAGTKKAHYVYLNDAGKLKITKIAPPAGKKHVLVKPTGQMANVGEDGTQKPIPDDVIVQALTPYVHGPDGAAGEDTGAPEQTPGPEASAGPAAEPAAVDAPPSGKSDEAKAQTEADLAPLPEDDDAPAAPAPAPAKKAASAKPAAGSMAEGNLDIATPAGLMKAVKATPKPDAGKGGLHPDAGTATLYALHTAISVGKPYAVWKDPKTGQYKASKGKPPEGVTLSIFAKNGTAVTVHPDGSKSAVPHGQIVQAVGGKLVTDKQPDPIAEAAQAEGPSAPETPQAPSPDAPATPGPETAAQGDTPDAPGQPATSRFDEVDTTGWTKVGAQKGGNPGGTYQAPDGTNYYVKQQSTATHAKNEVLAAELYSLAGIAHADLRLAKVDGKVGTSSKIIDGAKVDLHAKLSDKAYLAKIREGFAVDAWLANWDVVGGNPATGGFDNIVSDGDGNPVRLDPGGALLFSGLGGPKGDAFGNTVTEWDKLLDGKVNPQTAKTFKGITDAEKKASAQRVVDITPDQIDAIVAKAKMPPGKTTELAEKLKARRKDLAKKAGLTLPEEQKATDAPDASAAPSPAPTSAPKATAQTPEQALDNAPMPPSSVISASANADWTDDDIGLPGSKEKKVAIALGDTEWGVKNQFLKESPVGSGKWKATPNAEVAANEGGPWIQVGAGGQVVEVDKDGNATPWSVSQIADAVTDEVPAPEGMDDEDDPDAPDGDFVPETGDGDPWGAAIDQLNGTESQPFGGPSGDHEFTHPGFLAAAAQAEGTSVHTEVPKISADDYGPDDLGAMVLHGLQLADETGKPHYLTMNGTTFSVADGPGQGKDQSALLPGGKAVSFVGAAVKPLPTTTTEALVKQDVETLKAKAAAADTPAAKLAANAKAAKKITATDKSGSGQAALAALQQALVSGKTTYASYHGGKVKAEPPTGIPYVQFNPDGSGGTFNAQGTQVGFHSVDDVVNAYSAKMEAKAAAAGTPKAGAAQKPAVTPAKGLGPAAKEAAAAPDLAPTANEGHAYVGFATAFQKAVKTGTTQWVIPKGGVKQHPTTTVTDQAPDMDVAGKAWKINPDGSATSVYSGGAEFPYTPSSTKKMWKTGATLAGAPPAPKTSPGSSPSTPSVPSGPSVPSAGKGAAKHPDTPDELAKFGQTPASKSGQGKPVKVEYGGRPNYQTTAERLAALKAASSSADAVAKDTTEPEKPKPPKAWDPSVQDVVDQAFYSTKDVPTDGVSSTTGKKYISQVSALALQKAVKSGEPQFVPVSVNGTKIAPEGMPTTTKPDGPYVRLDPDGGEHMVKADGTSEKVAPSVISSSLGKEMGKANPKIPGKATTGSGGKFAVHKQGDHDPGAQFFADTEELLGLENDGKFDWLEESHTKAEVNSGEVKLPPGTKSAIQSYTGSGYHSINNWLRLGGTPSSDTVDKVAKIDKAIASYTTKGWHHVARGIGKEYLPDAPLQPGDILAEAGFVSTSFGFGFHGQVRFNLAVPPGINAIPVNAHKVGIDHEKEFILPRNTRYVIDSDVTIGGTRYIQATVLPPADDAPPPGQQGTIVWKNGAGQ